MDLKDLINRFNNSGEYKAILADGRAKVSIVPGVVVFFDTEGRLTERITRQYGDGDVDEWLIAVERQLRSAQAQQKTVRKTILRKKQEVAS